VTVRSFSADCTLRIPPQYTVNTGSAPSLEFTVEETTRVDAPARVVFRCIVNASALKPGSMGPFALQGELDDCGLRYTLRVYVRFHDGHHLRVGDLLSTVSIPVHAGAQALDVPLTVVGEANGR
jgi:hypothetical protein